MTIPTPCERCGTTEREVEHSELLGVTYCGRCYAAYADARRAGLLEGNHASDNGNEPGEKAEAAPTFAVSIDDFIADKRDAPEPLLGTPDDCILPAYALGLLIGKGGKGKTTFCDRAGAASRERSRLPGTHRSASAQRAVHRERGAARAVPPQAGAKAQGVAARDQGRDLRLRRGLGSRTARHGGVRDAAERVLHRARDRPGDRRPARLARDGGRGLAVGDPRHGRPVQGGGAVHRARVVRAAPLAQGIGPGRDR